MVNLSGSEHQCKICLDGCEMYTALKPCGHPFTCKYCAEKLRKCPICKTPIQNWYRANKSQERSYCQLLWLFFLGFVFLCMRVRISLFVCIIYLISPVSETVGSSMFNLFVLIPSIVNKLFCFSRFNLILKIFIIIHHTWLIAHDIIGLDDNEDVYRAMYIFWNSSMEHFLHYFSRNLSVHTSAYKTKMNQFTAN